MSDCWRERCVQQARSQDALASFLIPLNLRSRFTHHLLHTVMTFSIFKILPVCYCSRRNFAQKAKSRGGTLVAPAGISLRGEIPRRHPGNLRTVLTVEIYSQYARKISICLNRGREESVGNDDVSIACTRKYEMVRMTLRQKIPKGPLR